MEGFNSVGPAGVNSPVCKTTSRSPKTAPKTASPSKNADFGTAEIILQTKLVTRHLAQNIMRLSSGEQVVLPEAALYMNRKTRKMTNGIFLQSSENLPLRIIPALIANVDYCERKDSEVQNS